MTRLRFALAGLLAAVAGVSTGHFVAGLLAPASSPVLAIGSVVIDLTPTPVKEWAIATFGTADKAILQASVLLATLALAALAGLLAQRRMPLAVGFVVLLAGVAALAALGRPTATPVAALPSLAAMATGTLVLFALAARARRSVPPEPVEDAPSRRTFVRGVLAVTALSALAAVGGQVLAGARTVKRLVLPTPTSPAPPLPVGLEATVPGVSPLQTPTKDFYRVDTNLVVPQVDVDGWTLEIDGMVERPYSLTFAELAELPLIERDITLTCVSNEVGGQYVGAARWLGVRLVDLLDRAGITGSPDQILSTAVDGFTISTPLQVALDGRDTMIAIGMNGDQLTPEHGFPARLITPGLYGFTGATKWVAKLTLTTYAARRAYWTERDWGTLTPIKTSARIDTPAPLSTVAAGRLAIGGVAWAQHRGVRGVDVRIDDGPWTAANLGPDIGIDAWRQWFLPWDATPGLHRLAVRATDGTGALQSSARATPFPDGSSGVQEVVVTVA